MKQEWFDKKIANEMQDFDSFMDFESAWKAIEAKRNKKKKRAIYFWLTCLGLLAVSGLAISFYLTGNNEKTISNNQHSITQEINEPIFENNKKNIVDENSAIKIESTPLSENTPKKGGILINHNNNLSAKIKHDNNLKIETISIKNKNELLITENKSIDELKDNTETTPNYQSIPAPSAKANKYKEKHTLPNALFTPNFYVRYSGKKILVNTIVEDEFNFTSSNKPTIQWGMDLAFGKYFRQLSATENTITDWVNTRQQLETPLDAFYAGIYLKKYFSERFFLQPGLGFLQHTARFEEFSKRNYSELVDDQLIEIIQYSDGTEDRIYGDQTANFTETQLITSYQKSRSSLLQIMAGLDFPFNKKAGVNLSVGASISLFTSISGKTIEKELQAGKYENLTNFGYKKSGQLYGHGNAGIYFDLNKNWKLSSGIQTMIGLNNQVKKENGFNEKFNFLGANISLVNTF
jgi:hypothetical protein